MINVSRCNTQLSTIITTTSWPLLCYCSALRLDSLWPRWSGLQPAKGQADDLDKMSNNARRVDWHHGLMTWRLLAAVWLDLNTSHSSNTWESSIIKPNPASAVVTCCLCASARSHPSVKNHDFIFLCLLQATVLEVDMRDERAGTQGAAGVFF